MKIRSVVAAAVVFASLSATTTAFAAGRSGDTPALTYVGFAKTKGIKLNLRNDSAAPMELKIGDNTLTLDAGKTIQIEVVAGTRIVADTASPAHQAGALIAQISKEMKDSTISIK